MRPLRSRLRLARRQLLTGMTAATVMVLARRRTLALSSRPATLAGDYEDPAQADVPFGTRSSYRQPMLRGYVDTWSAKRFLEVPGVDFNLDDEGALRPTARLLAEAGVRSARVEIGWGTIDYDAPTEIAASHRPRLLAKLRAIGDHGIRPLILLNANHSHPCPARGWGVQLVESAPEGARNVVVGDLTGVNPPYTGLWLQDQKMAWPLIVASDPQTGRLDLSAPLPVALSPGPLHLVTLRYHPFGGAVLADGTANPTAYETVTGWMDYVRAVAALAVEAVGPGGWDFEVWNEYTFGSDFLDERHYYDPPREFSEPIAYEAHGLRFEGHELVLPMTVDLAATEWPGVDVISGFANQRPWERAETMWPGQAGFSRHYYTGVGNPPLPPDYRANESAIDALSHRELPPFVPGGLHQNLPERWLLADYQTEFVREIKPFPTLEPDYFGERHRYGVRPGFPGLARPAQVWASECGTWRKPWADKVWAQAGVARDDPAFVGLMHRIGTKCLLRTFVFGAHKGLHTLCAHAVWHTDDEFALVPEAFWPLLAAKGYILDDETRAAFGEQMAAVKRVADLMRAGKAIEAPRRLTVQRLGEHEPRLVFAGDGTAAHPDRWNREDFAVLPFQLGADRYAVGCYVVTRDTAAVYDAARDPLDPARYAMPEQTFDLTLGNVRGAGATVSVYDPMTDTRTAPTVLGATADSLTVRLGVIDYPRFLEVHEDRPGPLITSPMLDTSGATPVLSFGINLSVAPTVTWGTRPARTSRGRRTLAAGTSHAVALAGMVAGEAVKVTVAANGLTATWPIWGEDVAGWWPI